MPTEFWVVVLFVLGATIGSFLNVCIYRIPVGKSLIWPDSHCGNCFQPVGWDNIPIIGWVLVGGRCRHCGVKLSLQYPLVELMSGVLAAMGYWVWVVERGEPAMVAGVYIALALTLVVATFIDLRWRIIPDSITYGMMAAGPVLGLVYPRLMETSVSEFGNWTGLAVVGPAFGWLNEHVHAGGLAAAVLGLAAGWVLIRVLRWVATQVFRKEAMGLGDAKLLAGIGGLLGWKAVGPIFLMAVFLGAVIGIVVWVRTRRRDIPFGPYLAAGTLAAMLFGNQIWKWYLGLMHIAGGDIL